MPEEHVELAQRCLDGDQKALREFVESFQQQVFALCLKMLRHRQDAEDTAQESLLRAVRYLKSWDPNQPLTPWVLKIAANRCRTALGKRGRTPIPTPVLSDAVCEATQVPLGLGEELQMAIDQLAPNQRTCFVLYYHQDLSITEIADIMDVPEGTIKTWLHRGRKQLAQRLTERGMQPE